MTVLKTWEPLEEPKENLVLEGVHYDIELNGLMMHAVIEQRYANPYDKNIEAVFTFPLAYHATLLDVTVEINGAIHRGVVKKRSEAVEEYETAVEEGDRAVMVEKNYEGNYTVSIANILPGDKVAVRLEYAEPLIWRQDRVRLALPTTFTPKYGDPADQNLDDVSAPAFSFFAENRFDFTMRVKGVLAQSAIDAPSHDVIVQREGDEALVRLADAKGLMDRDLVVTFETEKERHARSFALTAEDSGGYAAIASFYPDFGESFPKGPKSVTFVIDCSGSMSGVSIEKARAAILEALNLLDAKDTFNVLRFGSHWEKLFDGPVAATPENLRLAEELVRNLAADMGGTEMEKALRAAYAQASEERERKNYLFLVTDGAVYGEDGVLEEAERSGMAHYVVGIGYASAEVLLERMAERTGGAHASVQPEEALERAIVELFKKIDTPKAVDVVVEWPVPAKWEHYPFTVFDGDTFYAYALFSGMPAGEARLRYTLENGRTYEERVELPAPEPMAGELPPYTTRIVAERKLRELERLGDEEAATELSVHYRLFSETTSYILVDTIEASQKPELPPQTVRVAHMCPSYNIWVCYDDDVSHGLSFSSLFRRRDLDRWRMIEPARRETRKLCTLMSKLSDYFDAHGRLPQRQDELEALDATFGWLWEESWIRCGEVEESLVELLKIWTAYDESLEACLSEGLRAYLEAYGSDHEKMERGWRPGRSE